jgi:hypothetical protein
LLELEFEYLPAWCLYCIAGIELAYLLWAHVSLWFCAFNIKWRWLGYAARIYIVLVVIASFWPIHTHAVLLGPLF